MATRTITIALEAKVGGLVSGFKTAQQAASDFGSKTEEFAAKNRESLEGVGTAGALAGGVLVAGFAKSVQTFASFDKAMSSVKAATHESAENMELLSEAAIKAGADTAFSAEESARAIEEMAKAGVSTADILGGGLDGALALAAAGALDVGEAAETASSAMTQFGLAGGDIPHIADLLAAGAGKAQGSVHDLGMALNQTGLVASQAGLTIEETTGGLAAFASAGLIGSDAGTSFKTMLQRLNPQSEAAATLMDELGLSAYDSQGEFIGLSEYAGKLQGALQGMSSEQRNATMQTLFGSDAVRAAAVLYEQGAEGVQEWEDAVNDAGYAAETAALMQDNLAGDLEKLGGAFDTVFLKAGGTGNDGLRGLVQSAEDVIDAVGRIPAPVLGAIGVVGGLTGGALLLGGAFVTLAPRVFETIGHMRALNTAAPGLATNLGKVGKVAGVAAAAFVGFEVLKGLHNSIQPATASVEEFTQALILLEEEGGAIDNIFANIDPGSGGAILNDVNNIGDALSKLESGSLNSWIGKTASGWGVNNDFTKIRESIEGVDSALAGATTSGNMEAAAAGFQAIAESAQAQGIGLEETAKSFPGYIDALRDAANTAGVAVTDQELLNWAMGETPPAMLAAAAASDEAAGAISEVGAEAEVTAMSLEDVVEALFLLGEINMSSRESTAAFHDALRSMNDATVAAIDGTLGLGAVLNEAATDFDLTTEAGAAANAAFQDVARSGMADVEAKAREGLGQPELQANLRMTYDSLVNSANGMGITGGAADDLARRVLGVPDNVDVNSWMSDAAKAMAQDTTAALNSVDGRTVRTYLEHYETTFRDIVYGKGTGPQPGGGVLLPLKAAGGRISDIPGYVTGGRINYPAPSDMSKDNVLGTVNGKPIALQGQEWIINGRSSSKYDKELAAINAGTFPQSREYSAPANYGSASAGSGGTTVEMPITINGATDANAVRQAVVGDIKFLMQKNGVRLGG